MEAQQQQPNPPTPPSYMPLGEFAKRVFLLGGLIIAALTLWQLRLVLLMTFLAVVIAISLDVPVRKLQRYGVQRGLAILLVVVAAAAMLVIFGISIGTPMVEQTENLVEEFPSALEDVSQAYTDLSKTWPFLPKIDLESFNGSSSSTTTDSSSSLISSEALTGGALLVTSVGSFVLSVAVNLFLVVVVSVYLLADPDVYANSVISLIPKNRQALVLQLMVDLRQALVSWLVTQLISVSFVAISIWFVLGVILRIPNAIALGMLSGVMTFIPNFGPMVGSIAGLTITLAERPSYLLPVLITYIVVQQLEANLVTPIAVKTRLSVPAAALLLFQVIASVLFGFLGLLLAVPLFMVIVVLVRDLYVDHVLDNINTAIESRKSEDGETVLRVTSRHHTTQEIPLKQIFDGDGPFDRTIDELIRTLARKEDQPVIEAPHQEDELETDL